MGNFNKYADFDTRWKILTVWMTANDACEACSGPIEGTAKFAKWESELQTFLQNATGSLRNTLISLVSTLNISHVAPLQRNNPQCSFIGNQFKECPCFSPGTPSTLELLDQNIHTMNKRLHKFAADWRSTLAKRSDIAIVVQPFLEGFGAGLDKSFFSTLDCFHPSASAHQDLAIGLWNSMLCIKDRNNQCGRTFKPNVKAVCPTVNSVLFSGAEPSREVQGNNSRDVSWLHSALLV